MRLLEQLATTSDSILHHAIRFACLHGFSWPFAGFSGPLRAFRGLCLDGEKGWAPPPLDGLGAASVEDL